MKLLCIGDIHIKSNNIINIDILLSELLNYLSTTLEIINYIILLGDILHYHEKIFTKSLNTAYNFIDKLRQLYPIIVIVGNHDLQDNMQICTTNHWMNGMKEWDNVYIIDKPKIFDNIFVCIPYVPPGKFKEQLFFFLNDDWKDKKVIFCHQEFKGCKMGAITSIDGDEWSKDNPYIISGHIHDKQWIDNNIYYTGSSMQHAFGESNDKSICLVNLEGCSLNNMIQEIYLNIPKKEIIYENIKNVDKIIDKLDNREMKETKITLNGNYEEFKTFKKSKKYKELINKGIKVVYKQRRIDKIKNNEQYEDNGDFYEMLNNLVLKDKDEELYKTYEYIFYGKENENIIIFS